MGSFESLDETFDIVPTETEVEKPVKKEKPLRVSDKEDDREKDYQYARSSLYNIVDKMQEALDGALEVAQQSDHPRAYEVALNGAKNAAEVVEKLQDLHKKTKDLEIEEVKVQQNNSTTNNVFMSGSTAELMKMLKESQQTK
jgi:hypothetical protein